VTRTYTAEEVRQMVREDWTEELFQDMLIDLAHRLGWSVVHFRTVCVRRANGSVYWETPFQADGEGFFDNVLTRERVIYAELKSKHGRQKPAQKVWADRMERAKQEHYCWWPKDWDDIERILA
jgi:hypothetical protein